MRAESHAPDGVPMRAEPDEASGETMRVMAADTSEADEVRQDDEARATALEAREEASTGDVPLPTYQLFVRHTRTLTLEVRAADDVGSLLMAAERKAGIPSGWSWIAFAGKKLIPGRTLATTGILSGATVQLAAVSYTHLTLPTKA